MSAIDRTASGRFAKGSCPNPKGRGAKSPKLPKIHRFAQMNNHAAFAIAEQTVTMTVGGEVREVSLYEANLFQLATAGAQGNRMAAKVFITEVQRAAHDYEEHIGTSNAFILRNRELEAICQAQQERLNELGESPPKGGGVWVVSDRKHAELQADRARRGGAVSTE